MTGTKKNVRLEQFRNHCKPKDGEYWSGSFSQELVSSALQLLQIALEQRIKHVFRSPNNHYTSHAPAIVVLAVTAFDIWATECVIGLKMLDSSFPELAEIPTCKRNSELLKRLNGSVSPHEAELRSVVDVRDEIVHFLPRSLPDQALPAWIDTLDKRDLLIKSTHKDTDFDLSQKLGSYALAYWACSTVASCVETIIATVPMDIAPFAGAGTASNFYKFRTIVGPDNFPEFDLQKGIVM